MAVIGIEFTSSFSQFFFFAMLLVFAVALVWLFRRMMQREALLKIVLRENSKLRNEVANIVGWTVDGRLPDDWQEMLQNHQVSPDGQNTSLSDSISDPTLLMSYQALRSIDPPYFASNDSNEAMEHEHNRLVELLEGLALGRIDPEPALANGEFDRLICIWRRLETYFPDEPETFIYGIAANAVLGSLKNKAIQILAPRPLSVANAENYVLTTDDGEGLRDIARIRAGALSASTNLTTLQPGQEIIVDCQRPGWNGPNGQVNPRILILDKSW